MLHDFLVHWDDRFTRGLGVGLMLTPSLDLITHLMGAIAVGVSIYCSISRNEREKARFRKEHPE